MAIDAGVLRIDAAATAGKIEAFIRDAVKNTFRRKGIVIGVSGGIDSAVAAALSVRALGAERVHGVILPERDSSPDSRRFALQVIESLGIEHSEFEITAALETFGVYEKRDAVVRRYFPDVADGYRFRLVLPQDLLERDRISAYRLEVDGGDGGIRSARLSRDDYLEMMAANDIKQRLRMTQLYYEAERRYFIVCGTTNRAETAQGFFVKFGDGGVDIEPLTDLYKSQVFEIGRHLGVPADVLARTPSPDTYSLPVSDKDFYFCLSYDQVDLLLYAMEHGHTVEEAAAALGLEAGQAARAWKDLERKREATKHLRSLPPVPDLGI
ncbi:MAG: NAD(+) synthase [Candidatus Krumholzibacteriota bacterium]|nr:NAD(+) synthase [Candidatus Krumholzibacteriota bacterium]